jgi:GlpG protein
MTAMRQIGTLPDEDQAQALADYLLTLRIETRLDQQGDGWEVWVRDEDRVDQARQELTAFQANPTDTRYAAAYRTAQALRREEDRQEKAYRKRQIDLRVKLTQPQGGSYRLAVFLAVLSIAVTVYTNFGQNEAFRYFTITASPKGGPAFTLAQDLAAGQVWRLITPIFVHLSILHLIFNLLWLVTLGGAIEERRGSWRFLGLVLVVAVTSNVAQYYFGKSSWDRGLLFYPSPNFGGMSGVVYGLFGYVWMKSKLEPDLGLYVSPSVILIMVGWLFLCMTGEVGPIANVAHVVGLAVGMFLGAAPALWRSGRKQ